MRFVGIHHTAITRGKRVAAMLICLLVGLGITASADAGVMPLDLAGAPDPDITLTVHEINYSTATDAFHADGFAQSLRLPSGTNQGIKLGTYNGVNDLVYGMNWSSMPAMGGVQPGQFSLDATIDDSGNLVGTGSFEVRGAAAVDGSSPNISLLSGTITDVHTAAFTEPGKGRLYFLATPTSGKYFDDGIFGFAFLIKLDTVLLNESFMSGTGFGQFGAAGTANVGRPVPEPSGLAIWLCSSCALVCSRGRRRMRAR